jgi:hypothetical protein
MVLVSPEYIQLCNFEDHVFWWWIVAEDYARTEEIKLQPSTDKVMLTLIFNVEAPLLLELKLPNDIIVANHLCQTSQAVYLD